MTEGARPDEEPVDVEHEPVPADLLELHEAIEAHAAGLLP